MIGQTIGNYRIDYEIGRGGMGVVYLATDVTLGRPVAIKFIHDHLAYESRFQQQFTREAQHASLLAHPGIVTVYAFNPRPPLYLVMEYIGGGSLRDYQRWLYEQQRPMDLPVALRIMQQTAEALHYAHSAGMIHADIKPDNVLLRLAADRSIQQAVLTDFGLARLTTSISQAGQRGGTWEYMSPELCRGDRLEPASDVYSLGIMFYELVTGRLPFIPRSLNDALRMHSHEPVVPPARYRTGLPYGIEQIILRALQKNPAERFQTTRQMAEAIAAGGRLDQPPRAGSPGPGIPGRAGSQPGNGLPQGIQTRYTAHPIAPQMPRHEPFPVAPGDAGRVRVIYAQQGQQPGFVWVDREVLLMGREPNLDIVLDGPRVSRQHARLDYGFDGRYWLVDLGSTNGTMLGGQQLLPHTPIEWRPGQVVRVGDFWLRLEIVSPRSGNGRSLELSGQPEAVIARRSEAVVGGAPVSRVSQSTTHRFTVKVLTDNAAVQAGGRSIATVEITNLEDQVDSFTVELTGLPASAYTLPVQGTDKLKKNEVGRLQIGLHPPRTSESLAGTHEYSVIVRSQTRTGEFVVRPSKLTIEPFYGLKSELLPRRLRRRGSVDLSISNFGNAPDTCVVSVSSTDENLNVLVNPQQVTVPPGRTERVIVRLDSRIPVIVGVSRPMAYSLSIKSTRPDGEAQTQAGELLNAPLIPTWSIPVITLLLIACVGISALTIAWLGSVNASQEAARALEATQSFFVQQTLTAEADVDQDGLSLKRENELGLDPLLADTDGDGLRDKAELDAGSNPKNVDTDKDGINDGTEAAVGSSLTSNDSDGDGIPDGADDNPGATAAPTLPPPTATPGPDPDITPPLTGVSFGDKLVDGTNSSAQVVEVRNDGLANLVINDITYPAAETGFIVIDKPALPRTIAPGGTLALSVVFNPPAGAPGFKSGELVITSNDPDEASVKIPLSGNAVAATPTLGVDASSLTIKSNFTTSSPPATKSVNVSNGGLAPLQITGFEITGDAERFKVNTLASAEIPITIAPGGSVPVEVALIFPALTPEDRPPLSYNAQLRVINNSGSSPVIALVGTFDFATAEGDPEVVQFGKVVVNQSVERAIKIFNCGTIDLDLTDFQIVDQNEPPAAKVFSVEGNPLKVGVSTDCQAGKRKIVFTPKAVQIYEKYLLSVTTTAPGNPVITFRLEGEGVAP